MSSSVAVTSPTPSERVISVLRELGLTPGHFFVGGSGPMALRDMRHVGDLDIGVTTDYWFLLQAQRHLVEVPAHPRNAVGKAPVWRVWTTDPLDEYRRCDPPYLYRTVQGMEVNVFFAWRRRAAEETPFNDYNLVFREGIELVQGWPCLRLPILLRQKVDAMVSAEPRDKDKADAAAIMQRIIEEGQ